MIQNKKRLGRKSSSYDIGQKFSQQPCVYLTSSAAWKFACVLLREIMSKQTAALISSGVSWRKGDALVWSHSWSGALSRRFYTPETTDTGLGYQMHTLTDTTINQHLTKQAADTRRIIAECLYSHHYHVHQAQLLHSTLWQKFASSNLHTAPWLTTKIFVALTLVECCLEFNFGLIAVLMLLMTSWLLSSMEISILTQIQKIE